MGRQDGRYRLVGRAMLDAEFRRWLLEDPKAAAESVDVTLTEEQVKSIQQVDPKRLEELVHEFQSLTGVKGAYPW